MANHCSKCGKKLGILSAKYKAEDGTVMCASCLKKWKDEQEEKKRAIIREQEEKYRKIMKEVISKYLADKDPEIPYISRICCEAYWFASFLGITRIKHISYADDYEAINHEAINRIVLDKTIKERPECAGIILNNMDSWFLVHFSRRTTSLRIFLEKCRYGYQEWLNDLESSIKSGLTATELDEIKGTIKMCEIILDFLDDLEKIGRLFKKKGIEMTSFEILSLFFEVIREIENKKYKALVEAIDECLKPVYEEISIKLGDNISKENVIREYLGYNYAEEGNYYILSLWASRLFEKFNIGYEQDEVEQLIEKVKEEMELEEFEKNLGAPLQEPKIKIGDFMELNGYEFEEYLKNLFELLDYAAIQTSLSGDQGADLILSKDDEKIVVQAKKYDGKVSNKAVQEVAAAKNYYEADRAMIVTNSSFTKSAIELAFSNDVELWDGRKLKSIIKELESGKR